MVDYIKEQVNMENISEVLDKNERILWQGKPAFLPFAFGRLFKAFLALFMLAGAIFYIFYTAMYINHWPTTDTITLIVFTLGIFSPLLLVLLFFVVAGFIRAFVWKVTEYAVTDKRIILKSGIIGREFRMIDFDKVSNIEVHVDFVDKLFRKNTGSLYIYGNFSNLPLNKPYLVEHVMDPYNIFKGVKKVSFDVKTDIEFPNQYRPKKNPGYRTEYGK